MARAALRREESRGGHYRSDFPARNDAMWGFRMAEQRTRLSQRRRAPSFTSNVPTRHQALRHG